MCDLRAPRHPQETGVKKAAAPTCQFDGREVTAGMCARGSRSWFLTQDKPIS